MSILSSTAGSTYNVYNYNSSDSLAIVWEHKDFNESNLQKACQHIANQVRVHPINNVMLDYSKLHTDFSSDLKKWFAQKWVPALESSNLKKLAIVLDNRLSQWFIEDILQSAHSKGFKVGYFHNSESARRWLNI